MCNRVQLNVQPGAHEVEVRRFKTHDVVIVSLGTNLQMLESTVRAHLDPEQTVCALSLWGDDDYGRTFDKAEVGFVISCMSLR